MQLLKEPVKRTFPGFCRFVRDQQQGFKDRAIKRQQDRIGRALSKNGFDGAIHAGPFTGMKYIDQAKCSALYPKLIGTYEMELVPVIQRCIKQNYRQIIDIGCAEGYYAVGFALTNPSTEVLAFDIDQQAQQLCRRLAEINGVKDHVKVGGYCSTELLGRMDLRDVLLICDCEGAEYELLDPSLAASLKQCDVLVELHEFAKSGLTEAILSRFAASHEIQIISAVPRARPDHPFLQGLSEDDRLAAVDEVRPPGMQWAWMTVKRA